ncbi:hypothetical protein PTSG_07717 [Salpingoeca rosetta]|uniref:Uncharacterized protein n=1 Tax=Salpingoeca rosetta (strain ATCC 50818 / BSB-021) TaxID=946362 RepID=F2UHK1_SALR5|nr:uncharacterized protein PTSG_07717 [Salpingoeca rosetta]EGD76600.1 hypothetical protein PTSG_07717 [Salpingoeca rosetta]|eukprot:XP_004991514.1 hypothetical protein PTSG_07717 [Salpingoeca rosetta]
MNMMQTPNRSKPPSQAKHKKPASSYRANLPAPQHTKNLGFDPFSSALELCVLFCPRLQQAQQSAATLRQHSNATSGQPSAPVATVTGQRYANRRREEQQQHQSEQCRHNVATAAAAAAEQQHTQQQHSKLSLLWSNGVTRGEHRERRTYKAHSALAPLTACCKQHPLAPPIADG